MAKKVYEVRDELQVAEDIYEGQCIAVYDGVIIVSVVYDSMIFYRHGSFFRCPQRLPESPRLRQRLTLAAR